MDAHEIFLVEQVTNLRVAGVGIVIVPATTVLFDDPPSGTSRRETKWRGGGQGGYQRQIGRFVLGAEGDFSPFRRTVSLSHTHEFPVTLLTPDTSVESRRDVKVIREFSIRARGGVAFGKTLIYLTAGYSQARVRVSSTDTFINPGGPTSFSAPFVQVNLGPSGPIVTTASEEQNMGGWTGGIGVVHKLGRRFSLGFEYRHTDYDLAKVFTLNNQARVNTGPEARGTDGVAGLSGGVVPGPIRISLMSDAVSARFNFHF